MTSGRDGRGGEGWVSYDRNRSTFIEPMFTEQLLWVGLSPRLQSAAGSTAKACPDGTHNLAGRGGHSKGKNT